MWSDLYAYYLIRSDAGYSGSLPLQKITRVLENTGVLRQKQQLCYEHEDHFPWIDIGIAHTTDGNFSVGAHPAPATANLIAVVTLKDTGQQAYLPLLTRIAAQLHWELVLEEDEEGNRDVIIFSPAGSTKFE